MIMAIVDNQISFYGYAETGESFRQDTMYCLQDTTSTHPENPDHIKNSIQDIEPTSPLSSQFNTEQFSNNPRSSLLTTDHILLDHPDEIITSDHPITAYNPVCQPSAYPIHFSPDHDSPTHTSPNHTSTQHNSPGQASAANMSTDHNSPNHTFHLLTMRTCTPSKEQSETNSTITQRYQFMLNLGFESLPHLH